MDFIRKLKEISAKLKNNAIQGIDDAKAAEITGEIDAYLAKFTANTIPECESKNDQLSQLEKLDQKTFTKICDYIVVGERIPFVSLLPLRLVSKKVKTFVDSYLKSKNEFCIIDGTSYLKTIFYIYFYNEITSITFTYHWQRFQAYLALCKDQLPKLEEFYLLNVYQTPPDFHLIAETFPNLKTLILDIKIMDGSVISALVNRLPNLKALHLEGEVNGRCLSLLDIKLEKLFVTSIGDLNESDFQTFFETKGEYLKEFFFFGGSHELVFRNAIKHFTNIEDLSLSLYGTDLNGFKLEKLTKLRKLALHCASLEPGVDSSPAMTGVRTLQLDVECINDDQFSKIFAYFPAIEEFHWHPKKDAVIGEKTFATLRQLPIKKLIIEGFTPGPCPIGGQSALSLVTDVILLFNSMPKCKMFQFIGDFLSSQELQRIYDYFIRNEFTEFKQLYLRYCDFEMLEKLYKQNEESNRIKKYIDANSGELRVIVNAKSSNVQK